MNSPFIKELQWRGLIQDLTPGLDEALAKGPLTGYVGFDPTADSLGIGNLVPVMLLMHFQRHGHRPIALVGGATGLVGDPSGKREERKLLDPDQIRHNLDCQKKQLERFLDFGGRGASPGGGSLGGTTAKLKIQPALMLNNFDWFQEYKLLDFIREIGKHITVNYLLNKENVQNRLATGLSFTEFSYGLLQGYDFLHLYRNHQCTVQMGGSDQWGNMLSGTELIRRIDQGQAWALTCPLVTKSDGGKFGKTEEGNVWLDPGKTSPYKFYQFWLNVADEDAVRYLKIFTLLGEEEIKALDEEHSKAPHLRTLQKALAQDITLRIHGTQELAATLKATELLFGGGDSFEPYSEKELLMAFEGVPVFDLDKDAFGSGIEAAELLGARTGVFASKGEARRMITQGGVQINRKKLIGENTVIAAKDLLHDRYLVVQRGKKNYFLIRAK